MDQRENEYPGLDFDRAELSAVMRSYYDDIIDFILTPGFQTLYTELMALPESERPAYVSQVIMSPEERAKRGVMDIPDGILLQTSAFGDRRPTLFAVKKFLPEKYHGAWENVNMTFGLKFEDGAVSRDPRDAWRSPLPVALQNAMLTSGADLEEVPEEFGVNFGAFKHPPPAHGD